MRERAPLPSFKQFLRSFGENWIVAMGGIVSIAGQFIAAFIPGIQNTILVGTSAIVCGFVAAYAVWKKERERRVEAENRFSLTLSAQQLITPLNYVHKDSGRQLTALALVVRINNSGAPTSSTGWQAAAICDGKEVRLQPTLIGRDLDFGSELQYGPGDDLIQKTVESPIPEGSIIHGVVLCSGDPHSIEALTTGSVVKLSCYDVSNTRHDAEIQLLTQSNTPKFFPGLGKADLRRMTATRDKESSAKRQPAIIFGIDQYHETNKLFYLRNDGDDTACNIRVETIPGRFDVTFYSPNNVPADGNKYGIENMFRGSADARTALTLTNFSGLSVFDGVAEEGAAAVSRGETLDFRLSVIVSYESLSSKGTKHEDRFDIVHRYAPRGQELFVERV